MSNDRYYIGGGNIAGILGISPYKTPLDEYLTIMGLTEPITDEQERFFNRRKKIEPFAAELFEHETGLAIVKRNERYVDQEHSFIKAEIDAETADANIEIKTCHPLAAGDWGPQGEDAIPIYVAAQAMHGLGVTGRDLCYVLAMIGFDDFRIYRIERDDVTISGMRARAIQFWSEHVLSIVPPDPRTFADVIKLFPKDTGTSIEADGAIADAVADLRDVKQQIKDLETDESRLKLRVGRFIGDNTSLVYDGQTLATWRSQKSRRLDTDRLKIEEPEIYTRFTKTGASRVLRLAHNER